MSKFNKTSTSKTLTTNSSGSKAYNKSSKTALISILLTSMLNDQYYRSSGECQKQLSQCLADVGPEFAAKAAIYARNKFGMRSITHLIAAEILKSTKGKKWMKEFISKVVRRPDDLTEIWSCYISKYGKPIPNALKKATVLRMREFDDYQLAKYKASTKDLSLVDIFNMSTGIKGYARPRKENNSLGKLITGTLEIPLTWETQLSAAGNDSVAKAKVWETLITTKKLGYMALVRNIRNISNQADNKTFKLSLEQLVDEKSIKNSLIFPYRFYSAYKEIKASDIDSVRKRAVLKALNQAAETSLASMPSFKNCVIILDESGSMTSPITEKSKTWVCEVAALLACVIYKSNEDSDLVAFSDEARYIDGLDNKGLLEMVDSIEFDGGYTDFKSAAKKLNKCYDNIIILSDNEANANGNATGWKHFQSYKKSYQADPTVWSIDLQGYPTMQFPEKRVHCFSGWSEKIFEIIKLIQSGDIANMADEIEAVDLDCTE